MYLIMHDDKNPDPISEPSDVELPCCSHTDTASVSVLIFAFFVLLHNVFLSFSGDRTERMTRLPLCPEIYLSFCFPVTGPATFP